MVGTNPLAPGDAVDPAGCAQTRPRRMGRSPRGHPAANLADAVPVSQVTWTSAQQITADVPERH